MRQVLRDIDSRELSEWLAFYSLEPFGEERADLRSAQICAVNANLHGGKRSKKYKIADFMPFHQPEKITDPAEQERHLEALTRSMGGVVR